MKMNGRWITVGTPDAIPAAEAAVAGALASASARKSASIFGKHDA